MSKTRLSTTADEPSEPSDDGLSALAPTSIKARATDALRTAIISGHLQPGDRLREGELSDRLGVSRAPVREALRQLEHEGLVISLPYRMNQVLGISQEEITQVLVPIRLTLETFAFRKALPLLTDDDERQLGAFVEMMRRAAADRDLDALAEADVKFHELVLERSGQPHCLQIWRSIEPRVRAYFRRDAPHHSPLDEVPEAHAVLLQAIKNRDEDQLIDAVREHVNDYLTPDAEPSSPDGSE